MIDRAASMTKAKRRINNHKHERVTAVIAQIKDQGRDDQLTATTSSRRRPSLAVRAFTDRS